MILSNESIHTALDSGRLVIEPSPVPRFPGETVDCPYQTTSVDLRLGDEVAWLRDGLPIQIDLRRGGFADLFGPNSQSRRLAEDEPFVLNPSRFVLGKTLERVELPIRSDGPALAARIEGRSSYARCGLLVHFTAPTIHAGFAGNITLELVNLGPYPILLYPRAYICQLIVEEVSGHPFQNESQFHGQMRPGGIIH